MSVPMAKTAMSFRRGHFASVAAVMGTRVVIAMSAVARWEDMVAEDGGVRSWDV